MNVAFLLFYLNFQKPPQQMPPQHQPQQTQHIPQQSHQFPAEYVIPPAPSDPNSINQSHVPQQMNNNINPLNQANRIPNPIASVVASSVYQQNTSETNLFSQSQSQSQSHMLINSQQQAQPVSQPTSGMCPLCVDIEYNAIAINNDPFPQFNQWHHPHHR